MKVCFEGIKFVSKLNQKVSLTMGNFFEKFNYTGWFFDFIFFFSLDICDENGMGNTTMCPQCDIYCPYWKLKDSCPLSKITYMFDNRATVFFAIFMSVWGKIFHLLEKLFLFKRLRKNVCWCQAWAKKMLMHSFHHIIWEKAAISS